MTTRMILTLSLLLVLGACGKPVEVTEDVRPVRAMTLVADQADVIAEFSGEVRPRIETRLGFRVAGKIVTRKVDVGALVRPGQVLAELDPADLQLAQAAARAQAASAETDRDLTRADLKRYTDLRDKGFISGAELERRQSLYNAAQARFDQASAQLRQQGNQTAYAALVADSAGIVTGVDAEVGQVVTAGQPVLRVARPEEKEVVFGIPENRVAALRAITDVQVRTWAQPARAIAGHIREIAPIADAVTRTYTARVALTDAPPDMLLGMTATVIFAAKTPAALIRVPLNALYQEKGVTSVWVIDPRTATVALTPVTTGGAMDNDIILEAGVRPGQVIVTAGVHKLKPGQKVRILAAASAPVVVPSSPVAVAP